MVKKGTKQTKEHIEKRIAKLRGFKLDLPKEKIIEMYSDKDFSIYKIAKHFSCASNTIWRILLKEGIKIKGAKFFNKGKHYSSKTEFKKGEHFITEFKKEETSGENNPFFGKKHTIESRKKMSKSLKGKVPWINGKNHTLEARKKISAIRQGIPIEQWKEFTSFKSYDQDFDNKFKGAIRKRDNQICMLCGIHREKLNRALDVHHINGDKKMSIPQNCISLCRACHLHIVHKDDKNKEEKENWIRLLQGKLTKSYGYSYSEEGEIVLELNNQVQPIKSMEVYK